MSSCTSSASELKVACLMSCAFTQFCWFHVWTMLLLSGCNETRTFLFCSCLNNKQQCSQHTNLFFCTLFVFFCLWDAHFHNSSKCSFELKKLLRKTTDRGIHTGNRHKIVVLEGLDLPVIAPTCQVMLIAKTEKKYYLVSAGSLVFVVSSCWLLTSQSKLGWEQIQHCYTIGPRGRKMHHVEKVYHVMSRVWYFMYGIMAFHVWYGIFH